MYLWRGDGRGGVLNKFLWRLIEFLHRKFLYRVLEFLHRTFLYRKFSCRVFNKIFIECFYGSYMVAFNKRTYRMRMFLWREEGRGGDGND